MAETQRGFVFAVHQKTQRLRGIHDGLGLWCAENVSNGVPQVQFFKRNLLPLAPVFGALALVGLGAQRIEEPVGTQEQTPPDARLIGAFNRLLRESIVNRLDLRRRKQPCRSHGRLFKFSQHQLEQIRREQIGPPIREIAVRG